MSKILRFRRRKRLKELSALVRPSLVERMQRLKQHQRKPQWWAMVAGAVLLCGAIGWALI